MFRQVASTQLVFADSVEWWPRHCAFSAVLLQQTTLFDRMFHMPHTGSNVYIVMHAVNNEILHVQPLIELFNAKTEHYCLNNNLIVNYFLVTLTHQNMHQVPS